LHDVSNDNGIRVINFASSKNHLVKIIYFKHKNIHKATWTAPDGITHNQIDHVLIDKRRHTNIFDVRSYRGADLDSDHFLVIAKVRFRLALDRKTKRPDPIIHFNLDKLKTESEELNYQVEISNRFQILQG